MVSLHYLMQRNIFTRIKLIKKYLFNKEKFMDETNATSKDVREIESDLQTTNHDIKNTNNVRYENGNFVRYVSSVEENNILAEQGLKMMKILLQ